MSSRVELDERGAPTFGAGTLEGWRLEREPATERTLRNALLSALQAEAAGDDARAYAIWSYSLGGGTIAEAVALALPQLVARLGRRIAGFTIPLNEIAEMAARRSRGLDLTPRVSWTGADQSPEDVPSSEILTRRDGLLTWEWPSMSAALWLAVDVDEGGLCRIRETKPQAPLAGTVRERLETPCTDPHVEIPGSPDEHTQAECFAPRMAEILGEDLPSFSSIQKMGLSEPEEAELEAKTERQAIQAAEEQAAHLARSDDPETSHDAAEWAVDSGHVGRLQAHAESLVTQYPGSTARELAARSALCQDDPRVVNRRLGEIEAMGIVARGTPKKCDVTGRQAATWTAADRVSAVVNGHEAKLLDLLREADAQKVSTQRKAKTYRQCLACHGAVEPGHTYLSVTGRARVHANCERHLREIAARGDGREIARELDMMRGGAMWT